MSKTDRNKTFTPNPLLADLHLYDPRIVKGADYVKEQNATPIVIRITADNFDDLVYSQKAYAYDDLDTMPFAASNNASTSDRSTTGLSSADTFIDFSSTGISAAGLKSSTQKDSAGARDPVTAKPSEGIDHRIDLVPSPIPPSSGGKAGGFSDSTIPESPAFQSLSPNKSTTSRQSSYRPEPQDQRIDNQILNRIPSPSPAGQARVPYPSEDMVLEDEIIQTVQQPNSSNDSQSTESSLPPLDITAEQKVKYDTRLNSPAAFTPDQKAPSDDLLRRPPVTEEEQVIVIRKEPFNSSDDSDTEGSHRGGWILPTILVFGLIAAVFTAVWFFLRQREPVNIQNVSSSSGSGTNYNLISLFRKSEDSEPTPEEDENPASNGLKSAADIIGSTYNGSDSHAEIQSEANDTETGEANSPKASQGSKAKQSKKEKSAVSDEIEASSEESSDTEASSEAATDAAFSEPEVTSEEDLLAESEAEELSPYDALWKSYNEAANLAIANSKGSTIAIKDVQTGETMPDALSPDALVIVNDEEASFEGVQLRSITYMGENLWIPESDLVPIDGKARLSAMTGSLFITADSAALMSEPDANSEKKLDLVYGSEGTLLQASSGWAEAAFPEGTGWVRLSEICLYLPGSYFADVAQSRHLNIRQNPDVEADIVTSVDANTSFEITEFSKGWGKIQTDSSSGWASLRYMTPGQAE